MQRPRPGLLVGAVASLLLLFVPVPGAGAVVGGDEAEPGEWPWQVAVLEDGELVCGGSLVGLDVVVTAAHCTDGTRAVDLSVAAGSVSLRDGERRDVVAFEQHEGWDPETSENDLSVLVLDAPFEPGDGIAVVPLASTAESVSLTQAGTRLFVTGFGATSEDGDASPVLLEAEIDAFADAACVDRYEEEGEPIFGATQVCAGRDAGRVDACYGDSGGPLVAPVGDGWRLVGVVSWGAGCGRPRRPTVYTEVAAFAGWLADHVPGPRFEGPGALVPGWGETRGKASEYPMTLMVRGAGSEVATVVVELTGLEHGRPSDLEVRLRSPSGTEAPVPVGGGVVEGFGGEQPNGRWELLVGDRVAGEAGSLSGWRLTVRAS